MALDVGNVCHHMIIKLCHVTEFPLEKEINEAILVCFIVVY